MHIYKLCKKCIHKWYFYGIFNFYHFLTFSEPFLSLFWPLVIFWINFLYIVICTYINCVILLKIALINGITMSIFNFYPFLPILDPFLTFFGPWLYLGSNSKVFKIHIKAYLSFTMTLDCIYFSTISLVGFNFFVAEKYR